MIFSLLIIIYYIYFNVARSYYNVMDFSWKPIGNFQTIHTNVNKYNKLVLGLYYSKNY